MSAAMPRVSVVIPSYNHAAFIGEAVHSVLTQTLTDLELLVIDDGSRDGSLAVLRGIDDARLRIVAQANQGAHAAINAGLAMARGAVLAVLNSDDAYHPERLARLLAVLDATPDAGLVGSHIEVVDAQGRRLGIKHGPRDLEPWPLPHPERSFRRGDDLRATLLTENFWSTSSNFILRRALWERLGPMRPLRFTHDWDFALRAAGVAASVLLPEALLRYRVHHHNTIRADRAGMVFEICWCLAVHLPQHLADRAWAGAAPPATRVEQLLHSIHAFGCERVLAVMLLERLHERPEAALALLDGDEARRARYLAFIEETLAEAGGTEPPPSPRRGRLSGWLRRRG
jgi:glycosyltransferase involved in cell wall biosynthesis